MPNNATNHQPGEDASESRTAAAPIDEQAHLLCPECDYDLTGAPADRCPWCGWRIDVDVLVASAAHTPATRQYGVAAAGLTFGVGSLACVAALVSQGADLSLRDGMVVSAVLAAAGGHLYLAGLALTSQSHWPMRRREAGQILRMVGWFSVILAVIGASGGLDATTSARAVEGIVVNRTLEFLLRVGLFALPGTILLILRIGAFRAENNKRQTGSPRSGAQAHRGSALRGNTPDAAPFSVDIACRCTPEQLTQEWTDQQRPTTPAIEAIIQREWETQQAQITHTGGSLFNGNVARLLRATGTPSSLHLTLGPTCYRDFVGTNLHNAQQVAGLDPKALGDPLGISVLPVTRDGYLVLGRRSQLVICHAGFLHCFGGMLEESDRRADGYDVFGGALRELREELGIKTNEVSNIMTMGLVRDHALRQPELLFDANIKLSRAEVAARFASTLADGEHSAIEFVYDDPASITTFMQRTNDVTPVAQAALLLHGQHDWGEAWFEQTCYLLYGELPPLQTTKR